MNGRDGKPLKPTYSNKAEFAAYEKEKMECFSRSDRDVKIAAAKKMLDEGKIPQSHFDAIAANLK
jgi:hypothetical protein